NVVGDPATSTLTISAIGGSSITELTGDTGGAVTPTAGNINVITDVAAKNSGSSVSFVGSGSTLTLNMTDPDANTYIGLNCGNTGRGGAANTGLGLNALAHNLSSNENLGIGIGALGSLVSGAGRNFALGSSLLDLVSGSFNIAIGSFSGYAYTSSESDNI